MSVWQSLVSKYRSWQARRAWRRWVGGAKSDQVFTIVVKGDGYIPQSNWLTGSLDTGLEAVSWMYACITGNAEAMASLPPLVQQRGGKGEDTWVPLHQTRRYRSLLEWTEDPLGGSDFPELADWGWDQLIETIAMQAYLAGASFLRPQIVGARDERKLFSVLPLDPTEVTIEGNKYGFPKRYLVGREKYSPGEVVHIMCASPGSKLQGRSPAKAAGGAVEIDATARTRQEWNLKNRAAPGLIVQPSGDFYFLSREQRKEIKDFLDANFRDASKDGTPMVTGEGWTVLPPPNQSASLNYVDVRRMSRDEILAIFRTPPPIVGQYENATLQNHANAIKIWWANALFPMLTRIYGAINRQLIRPVYGPDVRVWYDITGSEIGLLQLQERILAAQGLTKLGYPTNMAAARVGLGMPHVPELDLPNMQLVTAGRGVTTVDGDGVPEGAVAGATSSNDSPQDAPAEAA